MRMMGTVLRHPATKDAILENVPVFQVLFLDENGNIHYSIQLTITQLNEILYFLYKKEHGEKINLEHRSIEKQVDQIDTDHYNFETHYEIRELEELLDRYDDEYHIGRTYSEVKKNLSNETFLLEILFREDILYNERLNSSVNK